MLPVGLQALLKNLNSPGVELSPLSTTVKAELEALQAAVGKYDGLEEDLANATSKWDTSHVFKCPKCGHEFK